MYDRTAQLAAATPTVKSAREEVRRRSLGAVSDGTRNTFMVGQDLHAKNAWSGWAIGNQGITTAIPPNARVFYRLRVAGFTDSEETRAMCEALRARGIDCIPVTLP